MESITIEAPNNIMEQIKKFASNFQDVKIQDDLNILIDELYLDYKKGQSLGNNLYKTRLQNSSNNKGQNSGYRIITYYLSDDNILYLIEIYSKNKQETILKNEIIKKLKSYNLI